MARPVGSKDYPKTRQEFRAFFPDESVERGLPYAEAKIRVICKQSPAGN